MTTHDAKPPAQADCFRIVYGDMKKALARNS